MITILRTGAGSAVAPGVIRGLREAGARVVAADMDPLSVGFGFADDRVVIPPARDPGFIGALIDACARHDINVLFPDVDEEMLPVAEARQEFERRGVRVLLSSERTIRTCLDKKSLGPALDAMGIGTPRSYEREGLAEGDFPLFVKPRSGRGSQGGRRVDGPAALDPAVDHGFLIQECLVGTEYTIDTLADLDGRFLYAVPRQRVAVDSGISVKGRVVDEPDLIEQARRVVEGLGIVGPGCLQCIVGADGVAKFIDCNPRLGGGVALSLAAGAPFLRDVVGLLLGEPVQPPAKVRVGLTMLRHWTESYIDPLQGLRAVLFDLDFTLYDHGAYVAGALRDVAGAVAASTGRDAEALEASLYEIWKRVGPVGPRLFDEWLAGQAILSPDSVALCVERFRNHSPGSLSLYPGADALLRGLRARGVRTGIVTDGHAAMQRQKVRCLGLADRVDAIVYTADHDSPKPDPRGLLEACALLGVRPHDALYVGDAEVDVIAARRAGARVARVKSGFFASRTYSPDAAPDRTFPDLVSLACALMEPAPGAPSR